jgi:hypothetical protein
MTAKGDAMRLYVFALFVLLATSGAANPPVLPPAITTPPVTLTGTGIASPTLTPSITTSTVALAGISLATPTLTPSITTSTVTLTGVK